MFDLIFFIVFLGGSYAIGTMIEKKHYHSLAQRDLKMILLPAVTAKDVIKEGVKIEKSELVYASAVISIDYFKRLSAALRNIFGGEIRAYESVLDRSRKEAILRMKEKVPTADIIINMRIETSTIGRSRKKNTACAEVLAYGTAITYQGSAEKRIKQELRLKRNLNQ
tara:strand:- start:3647 stop:4147 length:501 start_codon:yes stop_codon:yes gene_type:complete